MEKIKIVSVFLFGLIFLNCCAYYGKTVYLEAFDNSIESCSGTKIKVDPMLVGCSKDFYAISGVPVFPGESSSDLSELNSLYIHYEGIGEEDICGINDIYLENVKNKKHYTPINIWKSKAVLKDGIKYIGCSYKFTGIEKEMDYRLVFREDLFGCESSSILLKHAVKSGYHKVPLQ